MLERWLLETSEGLSGFLVEGLQKTCKLLNINTRIIPTSRGFFRGSLKGSRRIISICKELGATQYLNAPGGRSLYAEKEFAAEGIKLLFVEPSLPDLEIAGKQTGDLSIIHLLMHLWDKKCQ